MAASTWWLVLACATGCSVLDGGSGTVDEYQLSKGSDIVLADGATHLAFRTVHTVQSFSSGLFVDDGLPYVSVGDAWLEIVQHATITSGDMTFELDKTGCVQEQRSGDDYTYTALASCTVRVTTTTTTGAARTATASSRTLALGDRYATSGGSVGAADGLAVRSLGFYVGNVDTTTWVVGSASASLDVVTPFGVANLDIDAMPIIGHQELVAAGAQPVTLTVLDIGNTNTYCKPLPVGCINVFDLQLDTAAVTDGPVRVLDYR